MQFLAASLALVLLTAATTEGHSWLHCTNTLVPKKSYWQTMAKRLKFSIEILEEECLGWPRNAQHRKNWILASSIEAWRVVDGKACGPTQRVLGQEAPGAPMAEASPGDKLLFRFFGNGHSRWDIGSPSHVDPGLVRVYWPGMPNTDIIYAKDLTEKHFVRGSQANFSADAIIFPEKLNNPTMDEKANYMTFTVPENIQNGDHGMVWVWAWHRSILSEGQPVTQTTADSYDYGWDTTWTTCFDIRIKNSKFTGEKSPDILAHQPGFNATEMEAKLRNKACSKTCRRGGSATNTCTGVDCPPCWYFIDGAVHCYDLKDGKCPFPAYTVCDGKTPPVTPAIHTTTAPATQTTTAPATQTTTAPAQAPTATSQPSPNYTNQQPQNGAVVPSPTTNASNKRPASAPASDKCAKKCYRGGMTSVPCTGPDCPPCRYAGPGGEDACFDYKPNSQECPFPNALSVCKAGQKVSVSIQSTSPTGGSNQACAGVCYRGGMTTAPCSGGSCPPCLYKQPNGQYHCFEYIAGSQNCPFPNVAATCKADIRHTLSKRHRIYRRHH